MALFGVYMIRFCCLGIIPDSYNAQAGWADRY